MEYTKEDMAKVSQAVHNQQSKSITIIRGEDFPIYGQDIITQNLVVAICLNGEGSAYYDNSKVLIQKNEVAVVLPNHIVKPLSSSDDYDILLIIISPEFVSDFKYRSMSYDYMKYHSIPQTKLTEEEIVSLTDVVKVIKSVLKNNLEHQYELLINLLNVFFEMLRSYRIANNFEVTQYTKNEDFFNRFCGFLAKHYTESREVMFYADKLCLTPKYFSKIIHDVTRQSAGTWITNFVITKAKQLLTTRPDLNIQNISNMMGFEDQAAFSRYFRRVVGMSPKQFREISRTETKKLQKD